MLKELKYKNSIIPGYFIDQNGKIFDETGNEQEQKFYQCRQYFYFKSHAVHIMLAHSFFGYKKGYDIHHKNEVRTDNRLANLQYLTRADHRRLHMTGKKYQLGKKLSPETKAKLSAAHKKKPVFCVELNKVFESISVASKVLNLDPRTICGCCKGKCKTAKGYHFEYFN